MEASCHPPAACRRKGRRYRSPQPRQRAIATNVSTALSSSLSSSSSSSLSSAPKSSASSRPRSCCPRAVHQLPVPLLGMEPRVLPQFWLLLLPWARLLWLPTAAPRQLRFCLRLSYSSGLSRSLHGAAHRVGAYSQTPRQAPPLSCRPELLTSSCFWLSFMEPGPLGASNSPQSKQLHWQDWRVCSPSSAG